MHAHHHKRLNTLASPTKVRLGAKGCRNFGVDADKGGSNRHAAAHYLYQSETSSSTNYPISYLG